MFNSLCHRIFLGIAALIAVTLLASGGAHADTTPSKAISGNELAAQVRKVDDATLQQAAQDQADRIRQIPSQLAAQGVFVTADQESALDAAADQLQSQSTQPDFKDKVAAALKATGATIVVAAKYAGEGIGYAGTAVLAASFAPLTFTGDLVMGIAVGHGAFSQEPMPTPSPSASPSNGSSADTNSGTLAGHFEYEGAIAAGLGGMYLTYVGLEALGYTIALPVASSALGVVTINWLVCARFDNSNNPDLNQYCSRNAKLAGVILGGSARGGAFVGKEIHKGVLKGFWGSVHFFEKVFTRKKLKPSQSHDQDDAPLKKADPN